VNLSSLEFEKVERAKVRLFTNSGGGIVSIVIDIGRVL
jgi:hypothetical protein